MSAENIIRKIWDKHIVAQRESHPAVFAVDLVLLHEVTSAQAFQMLDQRGLRVFDPSRCIGTVDHSVPTRRNRHEIFDELARKQVEAHRDNCLKHSIPFCSMGSGRQGIVHVIGPEMGMTQPGMVIVCGDSHTATHGAFGALAFGVGTSELGHVLATGCLLQKMPKMMKVEFTGKLRPGVSAKDIILRLIAEIGVAGAVGHVIEYTGDAIRSMSMEERMTVCNMSIECGARAGLIGPDETTFAYLRNKAYAPRDTDWERAVEHWRSLASDSGCSYDREVVIDVARLKPMVTWGINPAQGIEIDDSLPRLEDLSDSARAAAEKALEYVALTEGAPIAGTPVDWAFVGSCTNGRIEDLRIAAKVLKGHRVHERVTFYVVPGSEAVMAQAKSEGLDRVFEEAGAQFRMPGCSLCLAMNDDVVPAGKRCISSSNRNFVGRQGTGSRTHLASPATVAASAIEGAIASCEKYFQ